MENTGHTCHMDKSVYEQNGYKDRWDYLESVAGEYGTDMMTVVSIAEILGENEDFDGLICALEDFAMM